MHAHHGRDHRVDLMGIENQRDNINIINNYNNIKCFN